MSGKAVLNVNSYTILDQVYESLAEWKEVKLEIQGHTDSQGSEAANLKLSQARADAVRMYLIKKGISKTGSELLVMVKPSQSPIMHSRRKGETEELSCIE